MADIQIVTDEKVNESRAKMVNALAKALTEASRRGDPIADKDLLNSPHVHKFLSEVLKTPYGASVISHPGENPDVAHIKKTLRSKIGSFLSNDRTKSFLMHPNPGQNSEPMVIGSLFANRKAVSFAGALATAQSAAVELPNGISELPTRALRIRDLIPVRGTTAQQIQFVQQTGYTNNAATVPMNTDPASFTALPQSVITNAAKTAQVERIGHQITVPKNSLEDVDAVNDQLENQMAAGVLDAEDAQLLNGTGTSPQIQGLQTHASAQTFAWSDGDLGDNMADALLNAIAKAWVAKYQPDGQVLHPTNLVSIMKMKDDNGNYLFPQIGLNTNLSNVMQEFRLWGLPAVPTIAQTVGTALVGAFASGTSIRDREQATLMLSYEHESYVVKDLVLVVCQERITQVIERPESFVVVTLDSAPV